MMVALRYAWSAERGGPLRRACKVVGGQSAAPN